MAIKLPTGYIAIPIWRDHLSPLRICVVARHDPDPVTGHLIPLRDTIDADIRLGCVVDADNRLMQYVELWVQNVDCLMHAVPACLENLDNLKLDRRWFAQARSFESLGKHGIIKTGGETKNPLPTFLDIDKGEPLHPIDPDSGHHWVLCKDDCLLRDMGLPAYSTSLHRYLYIKEKKAESRFIAITNDAPTNDNILPVRDMFPRRTEPVRFNPGGGLILVRPYNPIELEGIVSLLGGGVWEGLAHGRAVFDFGSLTDTLAGHYQDGMHENEARLFVGISGRAGRLVETLHLKLRLILSMASAVQSLVKHTEQPLLNLRPESFQVLLGEPGRALPLLWTATCALVDSGDAVALPVQSTEAKYYWPGSTSASIYRPNSASQDIQGRGTILITKVIAQAGGATIVEGTFTTNDRLDAAELDLLWFRLNLKQGRIDLYSHISQQEFVAGPGEWHFRSISQLMDAVVIDNLREAQGIPTSNTLFQVVPLLSTPCDLYSLGILAIQTLLTPDRNELPEAIANIFELAKWISKNDDNSVPIETLVQRAFTSNDGWNRKLLQSLGPHRLVCEDLQPEEAIDLFPAEVWWETLATVIRVFPGICDASYSRDYGDAVPNGIHRAFDPFINDLDKLLVKTRSMIAIDWCFNREVASVINNLLQDLVSGVDTD